MKLKVMVSSQVSQRRVWQTTVRAARGDFHRSGRDFHLSPPKTVNYGEGENKVIVNFDESPCERVDFTRVTFPSILFLIILWHTLRALYHMIISNSGTTHYIVSEAMKETKGIYIETLYVSANPRPNKTHDTSTKPSVFCRRRSCAGRKWHH